VSATTLTRPALAPMAAIYVPEVDVEQLLFMSERAMLALLIEARFKLTEATRALGEIELTCPGEASHIAGSALVTMSKGVLS